MTDPIQRALDGASDGVDVDWTALEAESPDGHARETVRALRQIAAIGHAHEAPARLPREVPFMWGPLEVREFVAHGAHGEVYRAWDPRLEREVALKLLFDEAIATRDAPAAIEEGRMLARVRHSNVVAVYGADRIDGQSGIWMEFVDGSTLRDIVALGGPLDVGEVVAVGTAVCSGLEALHRVGLLHRDLKAQNVVRDSSGRTILMDLSSGLDDTRSQSAIGGTPLYLAPELLNGNRATIASDIYALGVLLFFAAPAECHCPGSTREWRHATDG